MRATWIAIAALLGGLTSAHADDTGVAGALHDFRRVGGKTCLDGHFHDGSGTGLNVKAAMADAIKSWEGFTAFEYGTDWGSYSNSVAKSASCDKGGSTISCHVSSMPCKSGRR